MTSETIVKDLQNQLDAEYSIDDNTCYVKVSEPNYLKAAKHLKNQGFHRLLTVSVVDWMERGSFEVYFLVHKLEENCYVKVSTELSRDNPKIPSLAKFWPNATMHEREAWELFGISFEGNNELKPLFLEELAEIPPFKKEFNWRKSLNK
ncbi:MAG: hypothetical protein GF308_00135 [Candidatus Heimdallarchaeota archaeon]|nr:hypothetical protein [Candidatus Heimdallarchaeota archaeon]